MSAHTPGPWAAHWAEDNKRAHLGHWHFVNANAGGVALTAVTRLNVEAAANARLIAAAPELLAALEAILPLAEAHVSRRLRDDQSTEFEAGAVASETRIAEARAAIAKARGES